MTQFPARTLEQGLMPVPRECLPEGVKAMGRTEAEV